MRIVSLLVVLTIIYIVFQVLQSTASRTGAAMTEADKVMGVSGTHAHTALREPIDRTKAVLKQVQKSREEE